ncbi:hypothetical protein Goklo_024754 [Gossypium klotzschianum]|uniref:Uncharacterized protein n=1 Tax=Gossypium klotzschianum TaxID=34286 RepID=A0A7J8W3R1_9ROSI|nr:hypothetical protein [Gossypium klotzschianum]
MGWQILKLQFVFALELMC